MALEQQAIVQAGLDILGEEGFEALSLRKIADALGVQTPALYWHVRSRAELYGLMAEHMFREAIATIDDGLDAREWLLALGRALHAVHGRRRDAASLVSSVVPSPGVRRNLQDRIIARLVLGGFEPGPAFIAYSAVLSLALGWSLFESNPDVRAVMIESMDVATGFETSLAALVDGLFRNHATPAPDRAD